MDYPDRSAVSLARVAETLRDGDAVAALAILDARRKIGIADTRDDDWLSARALALNGDAAGERDALHRVLARDRRDLAALLAMGQHHVARGDDRAAVAWYTSAINQAGTVDVAPAVDRLLDAARSYCAQAHDRFAGTLETAVAGMSLTPAIKLAVDMAHGRRDLFLQQPTMFYYPGLAQRPWFERHEFDWVAQIEAEVVAIRDELSTLIDADNAFDPYIQRALNRPASSSALLDDPAWGAAHLWRGGAPHGPVAGRCPATMAALAIAPQPTIAGRSPMALFSRLRPGTHIAPHHGMLNTRLICHLPLIAPAGCAIRVGHETREWQVGQMLIFDDSFEHEAWNHGTGDRTVLLFEIWRPDVPDDDRAQLAHIFAALDGEG